MATYLELLQAQADDTLRQKVLIAVTVAADAIRIEAPATPNHTERIAWAKGAFQNPEQARNSMMWAVIAQNRAASLPSILNASDATVQTAVDNAVNVFSL